MKGIKIFQEADSKGCSFKFKMLPFFLSPELPALGVNKEERLAQKFGRERLVNQMYPMMLGLGDEVGIKFKFGGMMSSTLSSHLVIELASRVNPEDDALHVAVADNIFSFYFEQEKNIGDPSVLKKAFMDALKTVKITDSVVLEAAKTKLDAILTEGSPERIKEVELIEELESSVRRRFKVNGVPLFIVTNLASGKSQTVSGAYDPSTFVDIFNSIK